MILPPMSLDTYDNMDTVIPFKVLDKNAIKPKRSYGNAGLDLYAMEDCVIPSLFNSLYKHITYKLQHITYKLQHLLYLSKDYRSEDIEYESLLATKIKTGIAFQLPHGTFGLICDRSGMGSKLIKVFGGVIDSSYRGDVTVCLANFSFQDYQVKAGDRVAQLVIQKCHVGQVYEVDELTETTRNDSGFGSSGR